MVTSFQQGIPIAVGVLVLSVFLALPVYAVTYILVRRTLKKDHPDIWAGLFCGHEWVQFFRVLHFCWTGRHKALASPRCRRLMTLNYRVTLYLSGALLILLILQKIFPFPDSGA